MPIVKDVDLTHWKTVQEFNIEQAALLLAGIDPYDFPGGLIEVRNERHERWKMAWGFSSGLISAIRRGTLTPIICMGELKKWNDWEKEFYYEHEVIKQTDRTKEISKTETILTRDSLFFWVESEKVDFVRRSNPKIAIEREIIDYNFVENSSLDVNQNSAETPTTLLLPEYEHQSEGLEFIKDAIKQFWSTYDPDDKSTAPNRDDVRDYLVSIGATVNLAKAVDEVLRPFELKKGGRRPSKHIVKPYY
ncbi:hypothetical protein GTU79_08770 [Sodalis ligni]|uniref:hypothetical protein n=1 Tax=Sodalis ligni TaxID=2697027 RepID=UPI001BDE2457|nr:hypothetical protein [Sodalis ligni]QWA12767.1 hypothetical protein GTU79_08770 [Sodalis ligni]